MAHNIHGFVLGTFTEAAKFQLLGGSQVYETLGEAAKIRDWLASRADWNIRIARVDIELIEGRELP